MTVPLNTFTGVPTEGVRTSETVPAVKLTTA